MDRAWHFLGSSTLQHLGKLTLREDAWRLPTGTGAVKRTLFRP